MRRTIATAALLAGMLTGSALLGPMASADAPNNDRDRCRAAARILLREWSGQPIFEDLTWKGAPKVVTDWNDQIVTEGLGVTLAECASPPDRYGAGGGAVCGTDAQCAAYSREVLHEQPTGYAADH